MIFWSRVFLIMLLIDVSIALVLSVYAWRHRKVSGASGFSGLMICAAWWALGSAMSLMSPNSDYAFFWSMPFATIAITCVPVLFLRFVLQYTGRDQWLPLRRFWPFFIFPVIINFVSIFLPDQIYGDMTFSRSGEFWVVNNSYDQAFFWVQFAYGYMIMLASIGLLIHYAWHARNLYRQQALIVLGGAVCPFVGNIVAVSSGSLGVPELQFTLTPITFMLGALIWAWGLFRFQFLRLMPIAHEVIVQSMDDAVFVLDMQNQVVDLNPAAENILRQPAREALGKRAEEVFFRQPELVQQYIDLKETQTEIHAPDLDGKPRYWDLRISTLYRGDKLETGRLLVLRDITTRKLAELERENLIEDLEAYAHTVAHDLKNPLGVLLGYTSLFSLDGLHQPDEALKPHIDAIEDVAERMVRIVDELLLFASVREMEHVEVDALDMSQIVAEAQHRFTNLITERNVAISVIEPLPASVGYAPWVEEIWANYISNAIKYGGAPPAITIGGELYQNHSRFWVKDNGRGLAPEDQKKLFTKFSRLERQRADGEGLGLSIVQRIADKLGGTVGVESEIGKGSTFYFTLPTP